jgi:hypothetical protein
MSGGSVCRNPADSRHAAIARSVRDAFAASHATQRSIRQLISTKCANFDCLWAGPLFMRETSAFLWKLFHLRNVKISDADAETLSGKGGRRI